MNKKGQVFMYAIMVSFVIIVAATQLFTPLKDNIEGVRGASKLNCTSTTLTTGQSAACVITDITLPYWAGMTIAIALGLLAMKKFGSSSQS